MSDKKKKAGEPTYSEASGELEEILRVIESGELDLDLLSEKVERAAALLTICREKLAVTETRVKKVVADLGEPDEDRGAEDRTAEDRAPDRRGGGEADA
jgi:exodeoxyribonuclease VII small subunit